MTLGCLVGIGIGISLEGKGRTMIVVLAALFKQGDKKDFYRDNAVFFTLSFSLFLQQYIWLIRIDWRKKANNRSQTMERTSQHSRWSRKMSTSLWLHICSLVTRIPRHEEESVVVPSMGVNRLCFCSESIFLSSIDYCFFVPCHLITSSCFSFIPESRLRLEANVKKRSLIVIPTDLVYPEDSCKRAITYSHISHISHSESNRRALWIFRDNSTIVGNVQ